ncbi:hypothetical protein S83_051528, partial [Arachis hypogaea]
SRCPKAFFSSSDDEESDFVRSSLKNEVFKEKIMSFRENMAISRDDPTINIQDHPPSIE